MGHAQVSRPMLDKSFHRKVQSRKIFTHRESFETIIAKTEEKLSKASDQSKRYNNLTAQCTSISPTQDLQNFVHILALPSQAQKVPKRAFAPPQPPGEADDTGEEIAPILRNELVFDRHSSLSLRSALESLKREAIDLEMQIRQLQDAVDTLNRTQIRGIEGQLYNKVNEMQEDLSMKKFDLHTKQLHLAAIKTQVSLTSDLYVATFNCIPLDFYYCLLPSSYEKKVFFSFSIVLLLTLSFSITKSEFCFHKFNFNCEILC
uniref:Uncharacterized protein n=1 Tax=Glossina palpalis gambiensis TaxID=67801 RepID=A0A1B0BR69_9MUSC